MKKLLAVALIVGALSGCTAIKIKLAEAVISHLVTGTWFKEGASRDDYFTDNWMCQRDTSRFTPDVGWVTDIRLYYDCMRKHGWTLKPYSID